MMKAAAAEGTVGRSVGPQCPDHFFFLCYEIFFTESHIGISPKIRREEDRHLSSKRPSPAARRREAFAESSLSVKPSPRGTPLSAKALNPVVKERQVKNSFLVEHPKEASEQHRTSKRASSRTSCSSQPSSVLLLPHQSATKRRRG
jgi:hypothetical protein